MNTRLQVEHPVTEAVTGLDLVALQLRSPRASRCRSTRRRPLRGHAIEVRLYAEDPAARLAAARPGTLHRFAVPGGRRALDAGRRLDGRRRSSVALRPDAGQGDRQAPTRAEAAARARRRAGRRPGARPRHQPRPAGARAAPPGVPGRRTRHRLPRPVGPTLAAPLAGPAEVATAALAAALAGCGATPARRRRCCAAAGRLAERPVPAGQRGVRRTGRRRVEVGYRHTGTGAGRRSRRRRLRDAGRGRARRPCGVAYRRRTRSARRRTSTAPAGRWRCPSCRASRTPAAALPAGSLIAPMPGTVVRGARGGRATGSAAGQPLLVLEAMKMEHPVLAPAAGVVAELRVTAGSARWTPAPCWP